VQSLSTLDERDVFSADTMVWAAVAMERSIGMRLCELARSSLIADPSGHSTLVALLNEAASLCSRPLLAAAPVDSIPLPAPGDDDVL